MPNYTKMTPTHTHTLITLHLEYITEKRVLRIFKVDTIQCKAVTESGCSAFLPEGNKEVTERTCSILDNTVDPGQTVLICLVLDRRKRTSNNLFR